MRTALHLDDRLLADARKLAIDTGRTLTQLVEDALHMALAQHRQARDRMPITLHTCGGKELQPGVDLSNNAALADLMDEHD